MTDKTRRTNELAIWAMLALIVLALTALSVVALPDDIFIHWFIILFSAVTGLYLPAITAKYLNPY